MPEVEGKTEGVRNDRQLFSKTDAPHLKATWADMGLRRTCDPKATAVITVTSEIKKEAEKEQEKREQNG